MDRPIERRVRLPKEPRRDRRASVRFPLSLDIRYAVSHRRAPIETGSGQVIDLSSSGLRFAAQSLLEPGLKLDVAINWPVLLDGRVQLQLIVTGRVVWSNGTETSMEIERHDFRTRSVGLHVASPSRASVAGILQMIGRAKGATLAEIMNATGWQAHSVRGFLSTAGKKPGVRIESSKNDSGDRVYRIAK